MILKGTKKKLKHNQGVALLTAVIAMLLLMVVAMSFAMVAGTDIDTSRAYLEKVKTFYIAQAGMNRARTAISVGESGWYLNENSGAAALSPTTPIVESFGAGQFSVTASAEAAAGVDDHRTRGRVSIISTGTIGTRTQRILQENLIWRDMEGYVSSIGSVGGSHQSPFRAFDFIVGSGDNQGIDYGDPNDTWKSAKGASAQGAWIYVDFGKPVQLDHMLVVNGKGSSVIFQWTVDVWDDATSAWVPQVSTGISAWAQIQTVTDTANTPPISALGTAFYWAVVNFLKQGSSGADTTDCDDDATTNSGADHCVGVLTPGMQTTRRVRFTAVCVDVGCSGASAQTAVDWLQFKRGGILSQADIGQGGTYFYFGGADAREPGMLRPPKDLSER